MLQVEIFKANNEEDLTIQLNYFLKQIDEILIKKIDFSSFAFFNGDEVEYTYTALVTYLIK